VKRDRFSFNLSSSLYETSSMLLSYSPISHHYRTDRLHIHVKVSKYCSFPPHLVHIRQVNVWRKIFNFKVSHTSSINFITTNTTQTTRLFRDPFVFVNVSI